MVERLIKQTKAAIESIKRYLAENEGNLSDQEIDEVLEELASQLELLEILEGRK